MKVLELKIKGMTCPSCSASVEKLIDELEGIKTKFVNHATDTGKVEFDEQLVSEDEIIKKINEGHYKVIGSEHLTTDKKIPECPLCKQSGQLVPNTVFKSNLKTESFHKINTNIENYVCMHPECSVAYYNNENNSVIKVCKLKRELWWKSASKRKIICYCNNIDREMIKNAVQNEQLYTWEDITSHYRKKVIEKCEILNPTGYCCREKFGKVIQKFR